MAATEECGIRCAYHGWKFDVDGNCVEIPTISPRDTATYEGLRSRVKIASYPTREWGDYVWAYLGPPEAMPALPEMEFAMVSAGAPVRHEEAAGMQLGAGRRGRHRHRAFLVPARAAGNHEDSIGTMTRGYAPRTMGQDQIRWMVNDGAPRYTVEKHDAGLVLAGARHADGEELYWRIAQYLLPCHSFTPGTAKGEAYHGQTWVPIDDENCWIYTYTWNPERKLTDEERAAYAGGASIHAEVDGDYVPIRRRSNDYLIDREMQKHVNFSGIKGISEQDQAIQDKPGAASTTARANISAPLILAWCSSVC